MVGVISANFEGSRKAPVATESFIHLHRIFFSFKILKGMFPQENVSVSSNVEITSGTSLGVTGRKEKGLIVRYLLLIFFTLG